MKNKEYIDNLEIREFKITDDDYNFLGDLSVVSLVTDPAIEESYQLFKKAPKKEIFKISNTEKMEITGPVMIPNKKILRYDELMDEYYYCFFSTETVKKCMEYYLKNNNHTQVNFEHTKHFTDEVYLIESWQIEDPKSDKAKALGFDLPKGTWMATYKVSNPELWKKLKESDFKGFSVEGSFVEKFENIEMKEERETAQNINDLISDLFFSNEEKRKFIKDIATFYSFINVGELSFTDYPESAVENAKRALKWKEEAVNSRSCGTQVGWVRANQLANKEPISYSTVKRMAAFIRHESNALRGSYDEGCAKIMWDAWGGTEGINWAIRKVQQIEKLIDEENMLREGKNRQNSSPASDSNTK